MEEYKEILTAAKETVGVLGGLEQVTNRVSKTVCKQLGRLHADMQEALDPRLAEGFVVSTAAVAAVLEKELLVLRMRFGQLKAAVADAVAPIGMLVVPVLNGALLALLRFVKAAGLVIRALFGGAAAGQAMGAGMEEAAEAGKKAAAAGGKVSRSLAGFDQLTRLDGPAGSSGGGSVQAPTVTVMQTVTDTLTPQLQAIVFKIQALLEPLRNIDFTPLLQQLSALGAAFTTFGGSVWQALESLWYGMLTPFIAWILEQFAPAFLQVLTAALQAVSAALQPVSEGVGLLMQSMQPVFAFIGQTVLLTLGLLQQAFEKLTAVFQEKSPQITGIFQNIGTVISAVFTAVSPVLSRLRDLWVATFGALSTAAANSLAWVIEALHGVTGFLADVFAGRWTSVWESLLSCLKGAVNGIIGFLNRMISGIAGAINGVVQAVNRLSFRVPDWVPELGGKLFGFQLNTVPVPQIPYLARGAVLPANKPFLAMVGDQKHGTNVEAPLSTIQEAVALVMEDYAAGNLAGHEATVSVLRQILEAVLGISIGDDVIAGAVSRQQARMAVVKGGVL